MPREPAAPVHGWWWGTGRRKASVARVRVQPGSAGVLCNGKPLEEYFCTPRDRNSVMAVLEATNMLGQVSVKANLTGGGTTGQAGAMVMGLASAARLRPIGRSGAPRARVPQPRRPSRRTQEVRTTRSPSLPVLQALIAGNSFQIFRGDRKVAAFMPEAGMAPTPAR